jgi:N-acetylglutamate synthase-like GNAT family acetyltransferase
MAVRVRAAGPDDQSVIAGLVRQARLNPRDLRWSRFVVAERERDRAVVAVAQVRVYPDGTRELASLVVQPARRSLGVATSLVDALMAAEDEAVYTVIDRRFIGHFAKWGFEEVDPATLPRSLARVYRMGRMVAAVGSVLRRQRIRLVPLRRPATGADPGHRLTTNPRT